MIDLVAHHRQQLFVVQHPVIVVFRASPCRPGVAS
jgi:hypothetical protein